MADSGKYYHWKGVGNPKSKGSGTFSPQPFNKICQFYVLSGPTRTLSHILPRICFHFISNGEISFLFYNYWQAISYITCTGYWEAFVSIRIPIIFFFILSLSIQHSLVWLSVISGVPHLLTGVTTCWDCLSRCS